MAGPVHHVRSVGRRDAGHGPERQVVVWQGIAISPIAGDGARIGHERAPPKFFGGSGAQNRLLLLVGLSRPHSTLVQGIP